MQTSDDQGRAPRSRRGRSFGSPSRGAPLAEIERASSCVRRPPVLAEAHAAVLQHDRRLARRPAAAPPSARRGPSRDRRRLSLRERLVDARDGHGARPSEGSSSSSTSGLREQAARDREHLHLAARERAAILVHAFAQGSGRGRRCARARPRRRRAAPRAAAVPAEDEIVAAPSASEAFRVLRARARCRAARAGTPARGVMSSPGRSTRPERSGTAPAKRLAAARSCRRRWGRGSASGCRPRP